MLIPLITQGVRMKLVLLAFLLSVTSSLFAQDSQKCISIADEIDRKYCIDKYLQTVKTKLAAEKKTWSNGLAGDAKVAKTEVLQAEIKAKKDHAALVASEVALHETQLQELAAVKELTPAPVAAPKKEKKKEKKKFPFGIKL